MRARVLLGALLAMLMTGGADAAEFRPAVVFDVGGRSDRSFNAAVWQGVERFMAETGVTVHTADAANAADRAPAIRRAIARGATLTIAVGFSYARAIEAVAAENPGRRFAIIDVNWLDLPNLRQYAFREHEGSYLVGIAAALTSKTGTLGFVGGMDVPLIHRFACGYRQGAAAAKPGIGVLQDMTGRTPAAWNSPAKGAALAHSQLARGADVVFHAAGGTGIGVIRAAAEAGKFAIGVDLNQNGLAPGTVLTSMVKRVDVAAYETLKDAMAGKFTAGVVTLGLAEGGVDWALDEHNAKLISPQVRAAVEKARADIVAGRIVVHDYVKDRRCPL